LTVSNELFLKNRDIEYWQFEVIYKFEKEISSSSINFKINQPPSNGLCSIHPLNSTTTSLFSISCKNWYDENGIKDYSVWIDDFSKPLMIGFSLTPTIEVRLSNNSFINLNIHIRDKFDSIKEYNISSVYAHDDLMEFETFENSTLIPTLFSGNQNEISQILISISQQLNQINMDNLKNISSRKYYFYFQGGTTKT
jgi:hypothetical protein